MVDIYKCKILENHFVNIENDEYYFAQVRGGTEKNISLDERALMLLHAYYAGKISDEEIEQMYYQR